MLGARQTTSTKKLPSMFAMEGAKEAYNPVNQSSEVLGTPVELNVVERA